jgi:hypothetical protein
MFFARKFTKLSILWQSPMMAAPFVTRYALLVVEKLDCLRSI